MLLGSVNARAKKAHLLCTVQCCNIYHILQYYSTQYDPRAFSIWMKQQFYNAQPKRTLALKGVKWQGAKGYKDRVMVLLSYNADGTRKRRPLNCRGA
jgi:hypothetical protein